MQGRHAPVWPASARVSEAGHALEASSIPANVMQKLRAKNAADLVRKVLGEYLGTELSPKIIRREQGAYLFSCCFCCRNSFREGFIECNQRIDPNSTNQRALWTLIAHRTLRLARHAQSRLLS
jgi:hypothetical protein